MTLVSVVAGAVLVLLVGWDIMLTLLHPTARGPLSYAANRTTWRTTRSVAIGLLRGHGLSYAGPLAVVVNVLLWVMALWLGYALMYLPFVDSLSYDSSSSFGAKGLPEALYLSGAALTTAGFGDVAGNGDMLRLATMVEAASGFGVLSAAIAFILSIYPLISQLRSTGIQLADIGALELEGAARVVRQAGPTELAATIRDLTKDHEHLRRFPVLYYFESGNREESLTAVVRGSSLLLVALRYEATAQAGNVSVYADALERVIVRLLDDLERDFVGGRRRQVEQRGVPRDEGEARVAELFARLGPDGGAGHEQQGERAELAELLGRAETVLGAIAKEHGHDARPLLPEQA